MATCCISRTVKGGFGRRLQISGYALCIEHCIPLEMGQNASFKSMGDVPSWVFDWKVAMNRFAILFGEQFTATCG